MSLNTSSVAEAFARFDVKISGSAAGDSCEFSKAPSAPRSTARRDAGAVKRGGLEIRSRPSCPVRFSTETCCFSTP
jgi:hypothetical protein